MSLDEMAVASRAQVAEWIRTRRVEDPSTKLILLLLFDHAGPQEDGSWVTWVGLRRLAFEACLADSESGKRTVRKHLSALEKQGLIRRSSRMREDGAQTTNAATLLVPPPASSASSAQKTPANESKPGGEGSGARGGGLRSPGGRARAGRSTTCR